MPASRFDAELGTMELLTKHLRWLENSAVPELAGLIARPPPMDVGLFKETMVAAGFPIPPGLVDLLEVFGQFTYPELRMSDAVGVARSRTGLWFETTEGLFNNVLHGHAW